MHGDQDLLGEIAERTGTIPKELKEIHPTAHFCIEWDGMVIWEGCEEYEACTCPPEKV